MMFTAANQVAASEQLLTEAANAVSFADPLTTAYAIVALIVVLLWATGVLGFGRVEAVDRAVVAATGPKPRDRSTQAGETPGRQAGPFVVLDDGDWALACTRIGAVIELQGNDVRWRTAAGKRPWLAGTAMKQRCALLDIDALIGLLADEHHRSG